MKIKDKQKENDPTVLATDKDIKDHDTKINSSSSFNLSLFFNSSECKL